MNNETKTADKKTGRGARIARRVFTALLFVLFALILELNSNTFWGFILLAVLTAGFVILFETGVLRQKTPLKIAAWALFVGAFAGVLFLTYPPVRRVSAYKGDPVRTEVVGLKDGQVRGVLNGDNTVEIYAGIPYAAPPTGDLRWKEPQDPQPWQGVLEADTFAPMAMQPRNLPIYYSLAQIIGYHDYRWFDMSDNYRPEVSEDALYLNIWKPAGACEDLPVLVYIHGGSLQTGQPWYEDYKGENLAREGVIVVNMGYRLGVFGFLALEDLAAESPNGTTGNYGLLDQIKALQWVRDNIAAFGGDKNNVTLAGESAGSACVSALCTSPLAKGLFERVILESSTVASKQPPHSYRTLEDALASGRSFVEKHGNNILQKLRELPAGSIVGAADTEHHITVDGYVLKKSPYEAYLAGEYNESAALHGFNAKESAPFIIFDNTDLGNYEGKVRAYFKDHADSVLALYAPKDDAEAADMWAEIYGAVFFDYPHNAYNRLAVGNGIPVYEYLFSKDNGRLGCWHSGELIYFYANIPDRSGLYDAADRELMKTMSGYYLNFIRTGDPNGGELPQWLRNDNSMTYLQFGEKVVTVSETARRRALFAILDDMQRGEEW